MALKIAVLGAGPGGYVAAIRAAQLGADVTLIEKDDVGGTCLNRGCIPSKILKKSADLLADFQRAEEFGINTDSNPTLDIRALMARKNGILDSQRKAVRSLLQANKIRVVDGTAHIEKQNVLRYTDRQGGDGTIHWDRLILAPGSRPLEIPAFPFDGNRIISSNEALSLDRIPRSLAIVGGGVIGCEFAFIFNAFGTKVTLIEGLERVLPLPSVDQDCSKIILREMKKKKINVLVNRTVISAAPQGDGVEIVIAPPAGKSGLKEKERAPLHEHVEKLLVCVGRTPNSGGLGLENVGVATDPKGWILVDETMRTTAADIFAVGDILGPAKAMLAHVASREGEIAAENCLGAKRKMSYRTIPSAVFTTPEVANVGLSEEEAGKIYPDAQAHSVLFRTTGKAQVIGELAGEAKIVSRSGSGEIVGVHITGAHASDLIAEGTLALEMKSSVRDLAETIHAHPTLAETMLETALKAVGKPLHG